MITDYKGVYVDGKLATRLQKHLQSWHTVHAYISAMKDTAENVRMLAAMLSLELAGECREIILTRVHMTLSGMRKRLEFQKLVKEMK